MDLDVRPSQVRTPGEVGQSFIDEPLKVGATLSSGVEVVRWINGIYEENVVAQVWTKLWGDEPTDCVGWEARAFADIISERSPGVLEATEEDLVEILDDSEHSKVAFRSDTPMRGILLAITQDLRKRAGL